MVSPLYITLPWYSLHQEPITERSITPTVVLDSSCVQIVRLQLWLQRFARVYLVVLYQHYISQLMVYLRFIQCTCTLQNHKVHPVSFLLTTYLQSTVSKQQLLQAVLPSLAVTMVASALCTFMIWGVPHQESLSVCLYASTVSSW